MKKIWKVLGIVLALLIATTTIAMACSYWIDVKSNQISCEWLTAHAIIGTSDGGVKIKGEAYLDGVLKDSQEKVTVAGGITGRSLWVWINEPVSAGTHEILYIGYKWGVVGSHQECSCPIIDWHYGLHHIQVPYEKSQDPSKCHRPSDADLVNVYGMSHPEKWFFKFFYSQWLDAQCETVNDYGWIEFDRDVQTVNIESCFVAPDPITTYDYSVDCTGVVKETFVSTWVGGADGGYGIPVSQGTEYIHSWTNTKVLETWEGYAEPSECIVNEQCGRCSNQFVGWVEWVDRDGGCDDDYYNQRVEYPYDERCYGACSEGNVVPDGDPIWNPWVDSLNGNENRTGYQPMKDVNTGETCEAIPLSDAKCAPRWTGRWMQTYIRSVRGHWVTYCNLLVPIEADTNKDGKVSEKEAKAWEWSDAYKAEKCSLKCEPQTWKGNLADTFREMKDICGIKHEGGTLFGGNHYDDSCPTYDFCSPEE